MDPIHFTLNDHHNYTITSLMGLFPLQRPNPIQFRLNDHHNYTITSLMGLSPPSQHPPPITPLRRIPTFHTPLESVSLNACSVDVQQ